jgi:hypothetical protein
MSKRHTYTTGRRRKICEENTRDRNNTVLLLSHLLMRSGGSWSVVIVFGVELSLVLLLLVVELHVGSGNRFGGEEHVTALMLVVA